MAATTNDRGRDFLAKEMVQAREILSSDQTPISPECPGAARIEAPIPWIGALRSPRLGPMVVVGDDGSLVPLCSAGNLLRGCRNWWRMSQEYA